MSNYSSDQTLDVLWNGPYRLDVADSCMGEDVRILLDGRSAYLSPDEARLVAAALIRAAEATEEWEAAWERGLADPTPVPPATTGGTDETEGLRDWFEDSLTWEHFRDWNDSDWARELLASDWLRERDLARDARTRADALAKLAATRAVLGYREAELLDLKGPCSNKACRLHYAHSGPCDRADREATR